MGIGTHCPATARYAPREFPSGKTALTWGKIAKLVRLAVSPGNDTTNKGTKAASQPLLRRELIQMQTANRNGNNLMKTTSHAAAAAISGQVGPIGAAVGPARSVTEATDDLRHLHHQLIMDLDEERQFWRNELFKEHQRLQLLQSLCPAHVLAKYHEAEHTLGSDYSAHSISV